MKKEMKKNILYFAIPFAICSILFNCIFQITVVSGNSMYPSLKDNTVGISLNQNIAKEIDRLDIVVVKNEMTNNDYWIKRVIGLPNDKIEVKAGVLYINDKKVEEPFINKEKEDGISPTTHDYSTTSFTVQLQKDQYFLMGDNRNHSTDSRDVGMFKKQDIKRVHFYTWTGEKK